MADNSYILFNKSILQLRSLGRLGGKAYGRNQRARRALMPMRQKSVPPRATPGQSTAEAVAALDAQFPWLLRSDVPPNNLRGSSAPIAERGERALEQWKAEGEQIRAFLSDTPAVLLRQ